MSKIFYRATFKGRQWFGTKQREFECAMTGTPTTVINTYTIGKDGKWKWTQNSLAFDSCDVEVVKELPEDYSIWIK